MYIRNWLACALALALVAAFPRAVMTQGEEEESVVAEHMHEHLSRITTIKAAIIAGKLEDVKEPALWLADHEEVPGLPPDFERYITQMRTYARLVFESPDLASAADSVTKMAKTCGNCHLVNNIDIEFGYDSKPTDDLNDLATHMQRNQWATDRLWEGLIGPSDHAWIRGADLLIDMRLYPSDVTAVDQGEEIARITRRINALAAIGTQTSTPDARSDLLGELLGLCAGCHSRLRRGPAQ